jgi:hypothetical protein
VECVDVQGGRAGSGGHPSAGGAAAGAAVVAADLAPGSRGGGDDVADLDDVRVDDHLGDLADHADFTVGFVRAAGGAPDASVRRVDDPVRVCRVDVTHLAIVFVDGAEHDPVTDVGAAEQYDDHCAAEQYDDHHDDSRIGDDDDHHDDGAAGRRSARVTATGACEFVGRGARPFVAARPGPRVVGARGRAESTRDVGGPGRTAERRTDDHHAAAAVVAASKIRLRIQSLDELGSIGPEVALGKRTPAVAAGSA